MGLIWTFCHDVSKQNGKLNRKQFHLHASWSGFGDIKTCVSDPISEAHRAVDRVCGSEVPGLILPFMESDSSPFVDSGRTVVSYW